MYLININNQLILTHKIKFFLSLKLVIADIILFILYNNIVRDVEIDYFISLQNKPMFQQHYGNETDIAAIVTFSKLGHSTTGTFTLLQVKVDTQ